MREKQRSFGSILKRTKSEHRTPRTPQTHQGKMSRKKMILVLGVSIGVVAIGAASAVYFLIQAQQPTESQLTGVAREYEQQLPELKQKVDENKEDATARTNYAVALYASKNLEEARKQYEEAAKIDGNNATTYNNLGNVYRDLKQNDKAVEAYEKAISLNPQNLNTYSNLANLQLYTLNDAEAAITTYNKGIEAIENNIQLRLLLGIAYEYDKQPEQARATYQTILDEDPENTAANAALERL